MGECGFVHNNGQFARFHLKNQVVLGLLNKANLVYKQSYKSLVQSFFAIAGEKNRSKLDY